jgi:hypothetical protein
VLVLVVLVLVLVLVSTGVEATGVGTGAADAKHWGVKACCVLGLMLRTGAATAFGATALVGEFL